MKHLIAGGAGFIGSHLVSNLLNNNEEVLVIDNFSTGDKSNIPDHKNLIGIFDHDVTLNMDLVTSFDFDFVWNLACLASPKAYTKNPIQTLMTSVVGTKNLLDIAKKSKACFVFTSTSEIYGNPAESPQHETYNGNVNIIGPRACYDEGKRAAETLIFDYHRKYGCDIRVARLFNTYGPNMQIDDGRVISNFVVSAILGEPLTVYGDGTQTRSLCYIKDTINGLILLSNSNVSVPINIGNSVEFTISSIAKYISNIFECSIVYEPLPIDDPKIRRPDISRAKELLGWCPNTSFEDGIKKTIDYFCKKLSVNNRWNYGTNNS